MAQKISSPTVITLDLHLLPFKTQKSLCYKDLFSSANERIIYDLTLTRTEILSTFIKETSFELTVHMCENVLCVCLKQHEIISVSLNTGPIF